MNTPVLTAAQHEFAEIFERLERDFKLSKAAVSRELRIERSYVSMLINGQRTPRIRILESMRQLENRLLAGREPEEATEEERELNQMIKQIRLLEQNDRPRFEALKQVVDSMSQPAGSKLAAAGSKLLKKTAASVRKPVSK